ncbi:hypothetical protein KUC3_02330 [Alteromonas sp. KC3]|uniref:hypothetical protein n=1 Tax=unclassified Alteromonas TaxID=2614992 RepID=UPI001920671B|nr:MULTISPECIES: hypothetical protein [unclassified Alteromonas]BCO17376.1 hypothetical protein KUC3_02330 [Alteromonas sp. KC3]BCO21366.1 hypothetical protein KUC14_02350 [Alteromonas sp. KC14]
MKNTTNDTSPYLNIMKASIAAIFAIALGVLINVFNTDESNTTDNAFLSSASTFRDHVISSHWQWRVQQPTTMIMLIHYDKAGKEINRKPVRMNHNGWPTAALTDEGCEKVWTGLVASPLNVDGFKVHARYYSDTDDSEDNYWCRYSLSSGAYFDYYPASGKTTDIEF